MPRPGSAVAVLALLAGGGATPAGSFPILARQPASGAEIPLAPVESAVPVDAFYGYNTTVPSSAVTGFEMLDTSHLFFHLQVPGALSLVVIHDQAGNADGGAAVFALRGLPASATYAVRDDPGDSYAPDPPAAGATTATWNWNPCCTDGMALSMPPDEPFCIALTPGFTRGILSWVTLSGPSGSVTRSSIPSLADNVYLCLDCLRLDCPPVIDVPCSSGGGAAVSVTATGSSLCGSSAVANDFNAVGSSRVDLQACKLEYSIVSPK